LELNVIQKYVYAIAIAIIAVIVVAGGFLFLTPQQKNIVEIAVDDGRFTTLVVALEAADLVETLEGSGPFTVFAPTDDAFNALPAGLIDDLLADIPELTEILTYHVVSGEYMAADVVGLNSLTTIQGTDITIQVNGDVVTIDDATIIITDIDASNGVIHVIDAVITP